MLRMRAALRGPPSPAIDAGLDIAMDFDGTLEGLDFHGNPRLVGPPDLGWVIPAA
jgi:hypothetical protein